MGKRLCRKRPTDRAGFTDSDGSVFVINGTTLERYTGDGGCVAVPEGVEIIGEKAFCDTAVSEVILPSTIRRICDYAFFGCVELLRVNLPEGLSYIGAYAFFKCTSLAEISLPSTLKAVGEYSENPFDEGGGPFVFCKGLEKVNFSEGTEIIGVSAFYGCVSLSDIDAILNCGIFASDAEVTSVLVECKSRMLGEGAGTDDLLL